MKRRFFGFKITRSLNTLFCASTYTGKHESLKPVEMTPVYCNAEEYANSVNSLSSTARGKSEYDETVEPLAKNLRNIPSSTPYRVTWYAHDNVAPAKAFVYWAYRRLRELPPDWQGYYRRMLYQEVSAVRFVNQPWDCFMMVVDGYRKAKWVLRKYDVKIDESLIPKPYNNFWEETTHEERVWAHRRSQQMKELQALQRDEDEIIFGANMMDRKEVTYNSLKNIQTGMQGGTPVHAHDMPAPTEADLTMSPHDEEISSALMGSIEDDKLWNPVLRSRIHTEKQRDEVSLYSFEDEDEIEDAADQTKHE
ncbi:unnamed protein product [Phytomonas sp. EM1]|nr:unnamed protein product [Phytomonas sp. EM1]|eukprot:CCW61158.1 unnamed protein product [Phytomonas sp. isolate EM1]